MSVLDDVDGEWGRLGRYRKEELRRSFDAFLRWVHISIGIVVTDAIRRILRSFWNNI